MIVQLSQPARQAERGTHASRVPHSASRRMLLFPLCHSSQARSTAFHVASLPVLVLALKWTKLPNKPIFNFIRRCQSMTNEKRPSSEIQKQTHLYAHLQTEIRSPLVGHGRPPGWRFGAATLMPLTQSPRFCYLARLGFNEILL